jgi:hypothetical protein
VAEGRHGISGATSSSYYTPALSQADAGVMYSVVVSNGTSGVTSTSEDQSEHGRQPAHGLLGNLAALPAATQVIIFSFVNATNGK